MTHLSLILAVLWMGRSHTRDLTFVSLDFVPSSSAASQPPKEDLWQKPSLKKLVKIMFPKPKPTPEPLQAGPGGEGPIRSVAEVSQLPHFLTQVKAPYPEAAKHSNIEGVVVLQADIDAAGNVMNVEVIQSLGFGCDEAAVVALKQSTFTPAYEGSQPVPVRLRIPYRFKFSD